MANYLYQGDLPDDLDLGAIVAIDCETMGLNPHRDRLCVVQLSSGDGNAHLVQVAKGQDSAPNLENLLTNENVLKLLTCENNALFIVSGVLVVLSTAVPVSL